MKCESYSIGCVCDACMMQTRERIEKLERNEKPLPPGKRYYCEETTLDIPHGRYLVRLWLNNDYERTDKHALYGRAADALRAVGANSCRQVADYLGVVLAPLVTTVQVIETYDDGVRIGHMIYLEPL